MTETNHARSEPAGDHECPAHLAHHYDSLRQQYDSAKLGMWIFLITEVLFFGGLFCVYAVFRVNRPEVFVDGHHFLDTRMGALNTVVLIASSLTMALAVRAAQLGRRGQLVGLLTCTLACAFVFLGVKSVEYKQKWDHQLVPGQARIEYWIFDRSEGLAGVPRKRFQPDEEYVREHLEHAGHETLDDEALAHRIDNLRSFVGIYFALTGLHALHVIIGIGVIGWLLVGAGRGRYCDGYYTPVDLVGLYWHLVDMIWIFLFPLLYLIH